MSGCRLRRCERWPAERLIRFAVPVLTGGDDVCYENGTHGRMVIGRRLLCLFSPLVLRVSEAMGERYNLLRCVAFWTELGWGFFGYLCGHGCLLGGFAEVSGMDAVLCSAMLLSLRGDHVARDIENTSSTLFY